MGVCEVVYVQMFLCVYDCADDVVKSTTMQLL